MAEQAGQLKVDDVVDIFQDPITRNKFEGRARLVKRFKVRSTTPRIEDWEVRFYRSLVKLFVGVLWFFRQAQF